MARSQDTESPLRLGDADDASSSHLSALWQEVLRVGDLIGKTVKCPKCESSMTVHASRVEPAVPRGARRCHQPAGPPHRRPASPGSRLSAARTSNGQSHRASPTFTTGRVGRPHAGGRRAAKETCRGFATAKLLVRVEGRPRCARTNNRTASGGWRIIKTLGSKIYRLRSVHAFCAQTSSATVILAAALLGGPVSTTHVVSSSIMGVGAGQRISAVRWGVAKNIIVAWFITIPASGVMAGLSFLLFHLVHPNF